MRILPWHTNPFDLGAHLEDEHELSSVTIDLMDSDELRRTHLVIHQRAGGNRDHIHSDDPDLQHTSVDFG